MRHSIGDFRYEGFRFHAAHRPHSVGDHLDALLPFAPLRGMVHLHILLDRHHHAQILFLIDFHAAPDRIAVRRPIQPRRRNQVLKPQQQAGALRTAQPFAAGNCHQVEAHFGIEGQVIHRRHIRRRVGESRDAVLFPQRGELRRLDFAQGIVLVQEHHHDRAIVDSPLEILPRLHFHESNPAVANGVVISVAVRLLNDHLGFHPRGVRQPADKFLVGSCHAGCGPECECAGCARGYHGRFAADQRSDAFPHGVMQIDQVHKLLGSIIDGLHHFRLHQRRGQCRVGACGVNEWPDAQLFEVIALDGRGNTWSCH